MLKLALILKSTLSGAVLALLFVLEQRWPAVQSVPDKRARWSRNLGLWAINLVVSPWLIVPLTLMASGYSWRPDAFSGGYMLLADLLLLDLWLYGWHRANHRIPLLWRFHRIHHLDRGLDVSSALRFHFGEVWLSALFRGLFIVLTGINSLSVVLFETLTLMAAGFHHSNLHLPRQIESRLARLIVTPSIHWVHHHAIKADTDSNYATLLSCWDRLFRSNSATERRPEMPIGIEGETADKPFPVLLLEPFRLASAKLG